MIDDNGIPRTINKRVKVKMIGQKHFMGGLSADEIADRYAITLGDVFAALAYYADNRAAFEADYKANMDLLKRHGVDGQARLRSDND